MDDLKLALIVNAVSPVVGGVLLRGEKGTAKSTVVRALAALLPDVAVIEGCRFSCAPSAPDAECPDGPHRIGGSATTRSARLVELPVGASEDRVVGSLDLERALTEGVRAYQPGLLAAAHRGVLYVDEVNLLHDHLVDLLLDAAALGTSYVERDGVSVRHAARFLLVGTMNPEEGELRPQLLDRFGLTVEVAASRDPGERAQVVRRRLDYEADPDGFAAAWAGEDAALADRIAAARTRLPAVVLGDPALRQVTSVCAAFDVDGLRADLVTARAAVALAAWAGRDAVTAEDVRQAALLALPHRRRRNPFDAPGLDEQQLDEVLADAAGPDDEPPPGGGQPSSVSSPPTESDSREPASSPPGAGDSAPSSGSMAPPPEQAPVSAGTPYRVRTLTAARTAARTAASIRADAPAGRRVGADARSGPRSGPRSGQGAHPVRRTGGDRRLLRRRCHRSRRGSRIAGTRRRGRRLPTVRLGRWAADAGRLAPARRRFVIRAGSVGEHLVQLLLVQTRRVEGVTSPAVRQREQRRLPHVLGRHRVPAGPGGQRDGGPRGNQVRAQPVDVESRADTGDLPQRGIAEHDGRESGPGGRDPVRQRSVLAGPGRGEAIRIGLVVQPAAHDLGPLARVPAGGHLDGQPEPVEQLRAQLTLLRVHRSDQEEA